MNKEIAIHVENISKTFKLPHERSGSIKNAFLGLRKRKKGYETQKALSNISFEVKKGEFFGIVGRNGSGKSTLLKLIAQIYTPDSGNITVNGKLTPFIELGVGFNPELSGRENVFLNGALLGFSRREMEAMYDEIVEFAEIERFMDQKLKNYSSGMQVRLAFSIAIRSNTDILVLDEVLAVGDANFQKKCNDYFEQQKARGQTIILVTHDMASVQKYCTRAMMIQEGKTIAIGDPERVSLQYIEANDEQQEQELNEEKPVLPDDISIEVVDSNKKPQKTYLVGDKVGLAMSWKAPNVGGVGVALVKQSGERLFATNTFNKKEKFKTNRCIYWLNLDVAPGKYYFRVRLFGEDSTDTKLLIENGPVIDIKSSAKAEKFDGLVPLKNSWDLTPKK